MLAATGFQWGDLVAGKGLVSEIYVKSQSNRGTEKREVICGKSVYCRSGWIAGVCAGLQATAVSSACNTRGCSMSR
jgi:hypothetical protein